MQFSITTEGQFILLLEYKMNFTFTYISNEHKLKILNIQGEARPTSNIQ